MTIGGLLFPVALLVVLLCYDWSFTQVLPHWVFLLSSFSLFWYQTIDAVDGKQARRTDNCSALGQLLDHNLDQISYTIFFLANCQTLMIGGDLRALLLLLPATFTPHYSIEFRKHFTAFHVTEVGGLGATESLLIMEAFHLTSFFAPSANKLHSEPCKNESMTSIICS
jgi:phosphatidylglycerophosphate synthase